MTLQATSTVMDAEPAGQRRYIRNVGFDLVNYQDVVETLQMWRRRGHRGYVTLVNPYSVELSSRDEGMLDALRQSGLALPDGVGIICAARLLGYPNQGRVTGPTLMLHLCDGLRRHGYRHLLLGGADGTPQRLADRLTGLFDGLNICGAISPPFGPALAAQSEALVDQINAAQPDIVWVGLGAPKQEKWMLEHLGRVNATAMIGVGAAFDFHSGNVKWAPPLLRRLGLEWAHRLSCEPKRMWRRNLTSVTFLYHVLAQRLAKTKGGDA